MTYSDDLAGAARFNRWMSTFEICVMGGVFVIAVMLFGIAYQLRTANEALRAVLHHLKALSRLHEGESANRRGTSRADNKKTAA